MADERNFDNEENEDFIELTDEDGITTTFEILAQFPFNGEDFLAVSEPDTDESKEDLEVLLLQVAEDEEGNEILVVPDEELYDDAFNHFLELVESEDIDFSEDSGDED